MTNDEIAAVNAVREQKALSEAIAERKAALIQKLSAILDLNDEIVWQIGDLTFEIGEKSNYAARLDSTTDRLTTGVTRHCTELLTLLRDIPS